MVKLSEFKYVLAWRTYEAGQLKIVSSTDNYEMGCPIILNIFFCAFTDFSRIEV